MKYIWESINSALILLLGIYLMTVKDVNTQAFDKCIEIQKETENTKEMLDFLKAQTQKNDTIVILHIENNQNK